MNWLMSLLVTTKNIEVNKNDINNISEIDKNSLIFDKLILFILGS